MAWVTFGLSCLSFMWFSWALKSLESETLTESFRAISSVDGDIGMILFQLMDKQIKTDRKVRFDEFWGVWFDADTNNDKFVTLEEVRNYLAKNLLGPSSRAEKMFGNIDLKDNAARIVLFRSFDKNDDKYLTLEEVRKYLAENLLGPSSHAEDMFGNTNLTNNFAKVLLFKLFDTNNDYFVTSSEFYSAYTKGL